MKIKINKSLNEEVLKEDSLQDVINDFDKETAEEVKQAADKLPDRDNLYIESSPDLEHLEGDVEKALGRSLRRARQIQRQIEVEEQEEKVVDPDHFGFAPNVLIVGPAGTGKTARIKQWCKDNNVNLVFKDAKTMDPSDLGGIISRQVDDAGKQLNKATKLTNTEFDQLDTPDSILFLDELNRAPQEVTGSLLTLIQDHSVVDHSSPSGFRILKGFLFTVAAINPSTGGDYNVDSLDMAMKTRFATVSTEYDNLHQLKYLEGKAQEIVNNPKYSKEDRLETYNRYQIAKKLLTDPRFHFDTEDEEAELDGTNYAALNYRSFTELLNASDGTKEDFLDLWSSYCNPNKYNVVEEILDDYTDFDWEDMNDEGFSDIDDKANSVFENPFKKETSVWDDVEKYL